MVGFVWYSSELGNFFYIRLTRVNHGAVFLTNRTVFDKDSLNDHGCCFFSSRFTWVTVHLFRLTHFHTIQNFILAKGREGLKRKPSLDNWLLYSFILETFFSIQGYCYLLYENEKSIKALLANCTHDFSSGGDWYLKISSRRMRCKEVSWNYIQWSIPGVVNMSQWTLKRVKFCIIRSVFWAREKHTYY